MNNYTLEAVISDKGFIHFQQAKLAITSDQDWYISISPMDEADEIPEPKRQLELILKWFKGYRPPPQRVAEVGTFNQVESRFHLISRCFSLLIRVRF